MKAEWYDADLQKLEIDLSGAPRRIQVQARERTWKAADLIQRGMRRQATGHRQLRHLPKSITREMIGMFEAEIGYDTHVRGAQGRLAHIIVFGSINNDPQWDHSAPMRNLTPRIVKDMADDAEDATLGDAT